MNLTLNLEEEISLLDKYGLTPNELFVTRILLIFQDEQQEELLQRLLTTLKHVNLQLRDILVSLQEKEIILKSYKIPNQGTKFDPNEIPINKNFIKNLYKCSFELGKELFENYPQFGFINNTQVSLRGVSKHFNSLEDCYFRYGRCIGWNIDRHNEIIELVKWCKDKHIINQSLGSFVVNNAWNDLKALKESEVDYESIKLL